MATVESRQGRLKARLLCVFALGAPIFYSWATPKIRSWGWGAAEAWWVPWAHFVLAVIAIYQIAAPLIIIGFNRGRTEERRAERNVDHALLTGVGGTTVVAGAAFLLAAVGGGPIYPMYIYACVSFAAAIFWTWKYRHLLRELTSSHGTA